MMVLLNWILSGLEGPDSHKWIWWERVSAGGEGKSHEWFGGVSCASLQEECREEDDVKMRVCAHKNTTGNTTWNYTLTLSDRLGDLK